MNTILNMLILLITYCVVYASENRYMAKYPFFGGLMGSFSTATFERINIKFVLALHTHLKLAIRTGISNAKKYISHRLLCWFQCDCLKLIDFTLNQSCCTGDASTISTTHRQP